MKTLENNHFHFYIDKEHNNEYVHIAPKFIVLLCFTDSLYTCLKTQIDPNISGEDENLLENSLGDYFNKERLYVHRTLYFTIKNYFKRNKINIPVDEFCIIACYLYGLKKLSIDTSMIENYLVPKTTEIKKVKKTFLRIQSNISKNINSHTQHKLLNIIKRMNSNFNKSFEIDLSHDSTLPKKVKTNKKIILETRRIVAKTVHDILTQPYNIKSKNGFSSKTERKILGLFYWLLKFHLSDKEFFNESENIPSGDVTYSEESVIKDIRFVSGNFSL